MGKNDMNSCYFFLGDELSAVILVLDPVIRDSYYPSQTVLLAAGRDGSTKWWLQAAYAIGTYVNGIVKNAVHS